MLVWANLISIVASGWTKDDSRASSTQPSYRLSPEEATYFLALKASHDPSYQMFGSNRNMTGHHNANTVMAKLPVNTAADCIRENQDFHYYKTEHSRHSASCFWPKMSQKYSVKCNEVKVFGPDFPGGEPARYPSAHPIQLDKLCPEGEVCMPLKYGKFVDPDSTDYDDIQCVRDDDVDTIKFQVSQEQSRLQCSAALQVPGSDYASTSTTGMTRFVLTAEVSWANGKPYKAPAMFIRDETPRHPYDRAYRLDTDVVSAELSVGSYRGRWQSRTIRFCFEQLTGGHGWAVLAYTWFKAPMYRGRGRIGSGPEPIAELDT